METGIDTITTVAFLGKYPEEMPIEKINHLGF